MKPQNLTTRKNAKKQRPAKLTELDRTGQTGSLLTSNSKSSVKFKIVIDHALENSYSFKKLKKEGINGFSKFLVKTVGAGLTITKVEDLFIRSGGPRGAKHKEKINNVEKEVIHFDNGTRHFRIHGYYENNYFVIHRIDPNHRYKY